MINRYAAQLLDHADHQSRPPTNLCASLSTERYAFFCRIPPDVNIMHNIDAMVLPLEHFEKSVEHINIHVIAPNR